MNPFYTQREKDEIHDYGYIGASDNEVTNCIHCGRFFASPTWSDTRFCNRPKCLAKGHNTKNHIPLRG